MDFSFDMIEDLDIQFSGASCERGLYLAVFAAAFHDLLKGAGNRRADAIEWFKGERHDEPITWKECLNLFCFGASRLELIQQCIKDPDAIYRVRRNKECRGLRRK